MPDARVFTLKQSDDEGLTAKKKSIAIGSNPTYAVDFRNDLPANGRIITVSEPTIATGTEGGITFDEIGRDKTQAKIRLTGVEAGTYEVRVEVTYDSGASQVGTITVVVAE